MGPLGRMGPSARFKRGPGFKKGGLKAVASAQLNRAACSAGSTGWGPTGRGRVGTGAPHGHSGTDSPCEPQRRSLVGALVLWLLFCPKLGHRPCAAIWPKRPYSS